MAQVPYNPVSETQPDAVQPVNPYKRIFVNPDQFGAQIGQAVEGLGKQVSNLGDIWGQAQGDDASNSFFDQATKIRNGFTNLSGQDALNAQKNSMADMSDAWNQGRSGLSLQARMRYDESTRRIKAMNEDAMTTHAQQQGKLYVNDVNKSTFQNALTGIAGAPADPMMLDYWRNKAQDAAMKNLQLQGLDSPEARQAKMQEVDSAIAKTRVEALEPDSPSQAMQVLQQNKSQLGAQYQPIYDRLQARALKDQATQGFGQIATEAGTALRSQYTQGGRAQPSNDAYANIPDVDDQGRPGQKAKFQQWNSDPVGNSNAILATVHPDLQAIVQRAQQDNPNLPFVVALGKTSPDQGALAKSWGWSQTGENSHHNLGTVVDLWGLDKSGHVQFDHGQQQQINGAMQKAAGELGLNLRWGGLASEGGANPKFADRPNFELLNPKPLTADQQTAQSAAFQKAQGLRNQVATAQPKAQPASFNAPSSASIPSNYAPVVQSAASKWGVNPDLLGRQLWQESKFRDATSPAGAQGVGQFMPGTAARYGVNVHDAQSSIEGAAHYMHDLQGMFGGNQGLALAGYNWGEANVQRWLSNGADPARLPKETRDYVQTITGHPLSEWVNNPGIPIHTTPLGPGQTNEPQSNWPQMRPAGQGVIADVNQPQTSTPESPEDPAAIASPVAYGADQEQQTRASTAEDLNAEIVRRIGESNAPIEVKQEMFRMAEMNYRMAQIASEQDAKAKKQKQDQAANQIYNVMDKGSYTDAYQAANQSLDRGDIDDKQWDTLTQLIQRRSGQEDPKSLGNSYQDIFSRILLPQDDPNRIKDVSQVYQAELSGQLSSKGTERLKKVMDDIAKPDEYGLQRRVASVFDYAKEKLDFSQDFGTFKIRDPKGAEYMNDFTQKFISQMDRYKEKDPTLSGFPGFDRKNIDQLINETRPRQDFERDKLFSSQQQVGDAQGTDPRAIPAPQGVQPDKWVNVVSTPATVTGQDGKPVRLTTDRWAQALGLLAQNPRQAWVDRFNRQFPGHDGAAILGLLGVEQQAGAPAQLPGAQPQEPVGTVEPPMLEQGGTIVQPGHPTPPITSTSQSEEPIDLTLPPEGPLVFPTGGEDPGLVARQKIFAHHQEELKAKPTKKKEDWRSRAMDDE